MSLLSGLGGMAALAAGAAIGGEGGGALMAGGSLLGAAGGGGSAGNSQALLNKYNSDLQNALNQAIQSEQDYSQKGVTALNTGLKFAGNALGTGYNNALQQLISNTNAGFNLSQSLSQPYRTAGYNAQDALSASLGLGTPQGGSANLAQNNTAAQQASLYGNQIFGQGGVPTGNSLLNAPNAYTPINIHQAQQNVTPQQISQLLNPSNPQAQDFLKWQMSGQTPQGTTDPKELAKYYLAQQQMNSTNAAGQKQFNTANSAYTSQQQQIQQYNNQLSQLGYGAAPAQNGVYTPTNIPTNNPSAVPTSTTGTGSASNAGLQQFLNSPEYASLFGNQAGQTYNSTGQYDPTQAFAQNPGTQFAINQGMEAINKQAASQGLLNSGTLQKNLLNYTTGLVDQNYNTYLGQVGNAFSGYQGNLQQLAGLGSNNSGANAANLDYTQLGSNAGNAALSTAGQLAAANLGTGSNLASLYTNTGNNIASAQLNTGSAQANGLLNIYGMNAQQQNAQMASNAQSYNANQANQGALSAMGTIQPYLQNNSAMPYGSYNSPNGNGNFTNSQGFPTAPGGSF